MRRRVESACGRAACEHFCCSKRWRWEQRSYCTPCPGSEVAGATFFTFRKALARTLLAEPEFSNVALVVMAVCCLGSCWCVVDVYVDAADADASTDDVDVNVCCCDG
jgi:hypothetical protein